MREVAILLSHLRAVAAGRELLRREGRKERRRGGGHFLVIEEDAELGLLLSSRHDWLQSVLAALPTKWTMLQAAVIAELPWLKHLHKRLSSARRPYVSRNSLRGLSWPFSPPRVVWTNTSWVKPYWSAAAYLLSQRGANELLQRYWPEAPRARGVTIDTRSQLWPAADQLIFNMSAAFLSAPLLTQPVEGAHAEHSTFKRDARDFVFRTWLPQWGRLHETRRVLASVYAIGGSGTESGESSEWHASAARLVAGGVGADVSTSACNEGRGAAGGGAAWLPCHRMAELPAHVHISSAPVLGRAQEVASAALERWIDETSADPRVHPSKQRRKTAHLPGLPPDALFRRAPSAASLRVASRAAAELLAVRLAHRTYEAANKAAELPQSSEKSEVVVSSTAANNLVVKPTLSAVHMPPFALFVHRRVAPAADI